MAQNVNILSPRQPFAVHKDRNGQEIQSFIDHNWWRFLNDLVQNSGTLSAGVTIAPNSVITSGVINAGSTVTAAAIPNATLLGNSSGLPAAAAPQAIGPNLSLNGGTLDVAALAAFRLLGNPSGSAAKPGPVQLGNGLSFSGNILNVVPAGDIVGLGLMEAISYWRP